MEVQCCLELTRFESSRVSLALPQRPRRPLARYPAVSDFRYAAGSEFLLLISLYT